MTTLSVYLIGKLFMNAQESSRDFPATMIGWNSTDWSKGG